MVAAPLLFYVVPFVLGYGWSAINPMTPIYAGMPGSPDRFPSSTASTAVEYYGTGVVTVPFRARLRAYLREGDLPLWSPYSGLGQPFAAQGEGSPYFPAAVLRSVLPTSWANAVTYGVVGLSGWATYGLLRALGLGRGASGFGGAAWAVSGPFALNLARDNYADQFAMIPPVLLAAAWAIASRRALAYAAFAGVAGLHAAAGLLQIGVNTLLLLTAFLVFYGWLRSATLPGRLATIMLALVFLGLGMALAAPYVLPIVEAIRAAYNKNVPNLAFLAMPAANVVAFFAPLVWGQVFQSWLNGQFPNVVDWNNLYAHGGTGPLLLAAIGLAGASRAPREQRAGYLFFLGGLVFFLTRFLSVPPGSLVSYLPILSQQSPKHTQGAAAFCLVAAAAFGVEWLRLIAWRRALTLVALTVLALAGTIGWFVWHEGVGAVDTRLAAIHLGLTAAIVAGLLLAFWLAHRAQCDTHAALIVTSAVVGESSLYLLLGNDDLAILALRCGIALLVGLIGVLLARRAVIPATVAAVISMAAYGWIIVGPEVGLPRRADLDVPPRYMVWLHEHAGQEYRVFGIFPDFSSVGEIQDVEVVGPLATNEWVSFVDLVSSPVVADLHRVGSTFALTYVYDLTRDYPRARPLFDWAGVRYIVLDRRAFQEGRRSDHLSLLDPSSGLRVVYDDEYVMILESPTAQSKAFFTSRVREGAAPVTLARLHDAPSTIAGPVTIERDVDGWVNERDAEPDVAVPLAEYRPNFLRASFAAPAPGLVVVKDSPFPGWQATLNGQPAEIVQVNGLVRGVIVPAAGQYELTMTYRPATFVNGVEIAGAALVLLVALAALDLVRQRRPGALPRRTGVARPTVAGIDGSRAGL